MLRLRCRPLRIAPRVDKPCSVRAHRDQGIAGGDQCLTWNMAAGRPAVVLSSRRTGTGSFVDIVAPNMPPAASAVVDLATPLAVAKAGCLVLKGRRRRVSEATAELANQCRLTALGRRGIRPGWPLGGRPRCRLARLPGAPMVSYGVPMAPQRSGPAEVAM